MKAIESAIKHIPKMVEISLNTYVSLVLYERTETSILNKDINIFVMITNNVP